MSKFLGTETRIAVTAEMKCLHVRSSVRPHPGTQLPDVSRERRPGWPASDSWADQVTDTPEGHRPPRPGQPEEEGAGSLEEVKPEDKRTIVE